MGGKFRRGHAVQAAMGSLLVVLFSPSFDHVLRVAQVSEQVHVQAFVAKFVVEALDIGVLPRTRRFDVQGRDAQTCCSSGMSPSDGKARWRPTDCLVKCAEICPASHQRLGTALRWMKHTHDRLPSSVFNGCPQEPSIKHDRLRKIKRYRIDRRSPSRLFPVITLQSATTGNEVKSTQRTGIHSTSA